MTVAYHDACHLAHAQGIRTATARAARAGGQPARDRDTGWRDLLRIGGLYNVEHPTIARALGAQKAQAILATGAHAVAAGNIGCLVQIATHLARAGSPLPVLHTIQVLDRAYREAAEIRP